MSGDGNGGRENGECVERRGKKGKKERVRGEKICGLSDWRYPSVVLTMRACLLAVCMLVRSFYKFPCVCRSVCLSVCLYTGALYGWYA